MASAIELLTLARHAAFPPSAVWTDVSSYSSGNVTAATAITKAWTALSSPPAAGTVYTLDTEFTGTYENNAFSFHALIGGTDHQFLPSVAAGSWSAGTAIGGWLRMTVRVTSPSACTLTLAGAVAETGTSYSPSTGGPPLATVPVTGAAFAAGDSIQIGVLFGASTAGQNITTYGSTFTAAGAAW